MTRPLVLSLVAGVAVALVPAAQAQETPPQDERLPSLTPRVFESRGTVRVSLPDIERQPLTGFGPPPRTYVVPAEREPAIQPFRPDLDALSAFRLTPSADPPVDLPEAHRLRIEGGAGSQAARYGRVDLAAAGASGVFYADVDYDGADGPSPTDYVRFDRLDVRGGGQSFGPGRLHLDAHYGLATYSLPGAGGLARRQRQVAGAEGGVEGVGPTAYVLDVAYTQSRLGRTDDSEPESTEGRVDASARLGVADGRLRLDAAGGTSGQGTGVGSDVQYAAGGAALAFGRAGGLRGTLGARALSYRVSENAGAGSAAVVGPVVDLGLPLGPTLRAFAVNDPHVDVRTLASLADANPFVSTTPLVVPDLVPVDAQAGVEFGGGALRTRAYLHGSLSAVRLIFERSSSGLYLEDYVETQTLGVGGDLTYQAPSGISAAAALEVREGRIEGGGQIPFFAPVVGRAGLQVPLAGDRARIGLAFHAESTRPAHRRGGADAPAWALLSLDGRVNVTGPLALTLRGEHLVGTAERWPGFPEIPYQVTLGLRLTR